MMSGRNAQEDKSEERQSRHQTPLSGFQDMCVREIRELLTVHAQREWGGADLGQQIGSLGLEDKFIRTAQNKLQSAEQKSQSTLYAEQVQAGCSHQDQAQRRRWQVELPFQE